MSNIQVTHDASLNNARSESSIVINPNNPMQIVSGSKKFRDYHTYDFTLATAYSTDGGLSWHDSAALPMPGFSLLTDPALAWDDAGNVFLVGLSGNNPPTFDRIGIEIYKSTDGGRTWSTPQRIQTSTGDDKQWAAGDGNPASPFHGRVYAVWDDGSNMRFARTKDHGATWVGAGPGVTTVGTILANDSFSPEINVAANGNIYIVWITGSQIKMIVSTDGGDSFQSTVSPATGVTTLGNPELPHFPGANFRVGTLPTACVFGRRVAVAWADFRESVSRIYYALSINGGASWTTGPSGQPLLTGALPANLHHFHPQMISGRKGVIGCAFYEFGPKPTTPLIDVIMAQSFNGGASFNHFTVTDQPWDPAVDAPWAHGQSSVTFIGDYFGLDASVRGFYPLWTDTRTGIQELWTAIVGPFVLSEALPPHIIGRVDRNYQGADTGVPLLNSFYFRFEKPDSSEAVDNRINTISVFPAGSAEDLTPNADLKRPTVERGKIMLIYQDQAADEDKDHYFYKVSHLVEPSPPSPIGTVCNVRRFQIRDVGCSGKCVRALPIRPSNREVFVLVGFHLFFTGGRDHNIDEIAISEDSGNLTVAFNDRNDDDVFGYSVDYALWSPDDPQSTIETHEEGRTAHGGDRIALPAGEKVIQGFSFNFKTGDHFLREIGVLIGPSAALPSSNLEVYFGDKNGDDTFEWNVRWASMKPGVFK